MAAGDIIAAAVSGTSPRDGWVLELTIEGWSAKTVSAINCGLPRPSRPIPSLESTKCTRTTLHIITGCEMLRAVHGVTMKYLVLAPLLAFCSCGALERFNEGYDSIKGLAESFKDRYEGLQKRYESLQDDFSVVKGYIAEKKAEIDTNKDDKVSWEEFKTWLIGSGAAGGTGALALVMRNAKSNRRKDQIEVHQEEQDEKIHEVITAFELEKQRNAIDERVKEIIAKEKILVPDVT